MANHRPLSLTALLPVCAILLASVPALAACDDCGTVSDVRTVKVKGEGTGVGAVAGGVLGAVVGHQIGGGRGKDVATIAGAAGGAYAGHQVEKNVRSKTQYQVVVTLDNGTSRTFTYGTATAYKVGDKVRVVNNALTRRE